MAGIPPNDPGFWAWETWRPWIQGGGGAIFLGAGTAINWLWKVRRQRREDKEKHSVDERGNDARLRDSLDARTRYELERSDRERSELTQEIRRLQQEVERWRLIAIAWSNTAHNLRHAVGNARQTLIGLLTAAGRPVPPECTEWPALPPLDEIEH